MSRLVTAKVDHENGCEACWDQLRAELGGEPSGDHCYVLVPSAWVGRACPHGASECAPSILRADCRTPPAGVRS